MHVTLEERFALIDTIASGGMGKVYLARDLRDAYQPVAALKVLHPHLAAEREFVQMFIDEARVTTRLRHPNVVRVSDVERVGDNLVIVMEYVEGASVHDLQRSLAEAGRPMPIGFALRLAVDALAGLHFAHDLVDEQSKRPLGIVHRDVSPHNVLVGVDGRARIGDFGVARWAHRLAHTRPSAPIRGKFRYLAPEQVQRKGEIDRRADVFAAGIVLWECLAGRALFPGDSEAETVAAILWEPITPASVHRPELAQEIDDVVLRALERDPERRWATAGELGAALEEAGRDEIFSREQAGAFVEELVAPRLARARAAIERARIGPATPEAVVDAPHDRDAAAPSSAGAGAGAGAGAASEPATDSATAAAVTVAALPASRGARPDTAPRPARARLALGAVALVALLAAAVAIGRASKREPKPEPERAAAPVDTARPTASAVATTTTPTAPTEVDEIPAASDAPAVAGPRRGAPARSTTAPKSKSLYMPSHL